MRTPLHLAFASALCAGVVAAQTVPAPVPESEIFSPEQIGHALAAADAAGRTHGTERRECATGRRAMDHARQELRTDTVFRAHRNHTAERREPYRAVHLLARRHQGRGSGAHRRGQHDVHRDGLSQLRVRARSHQARRADEVAFRPNPAPASQGIACCDVVNRGGSVDHGKYIFNTLDGQTIALDVKTGKPVWRTQLGNIAIGETITMAPLVADGKVYVGNSGGEMGVRGWFVALDEGTGKLLWKAYATGPDKDVLIGPEFKPHYPADQGKDLGVSSWPPQAWMIGGGNMWGWANYDAELHTVYHGTGNPGPWNQEQRPGDNKWTTGIFSRDPNTGAARWYYQYSPHDEHDYDGINEQLLLDMPFDGKMQKVLIHIDRNGYIYVIERNTGTVLSADPFGPVNSIQGIDLQTGRPNMNPAKLTRVGETVTNICPTASGAKDWNPSSFSPRTGLLYIGHENMCMDWEDVQVNYIAGTPYVGALVHMKPGPGGNRGLMTAWDPVARKPVWQDKENFPIWSSSVVTASDVLFYGTMDGWFKAVNARTGELLWRFKVDSGIISQPVSYRGPDGRQYIAVLSGVGGWSGAVVSGPVDPRDGSAALGMVAAMSDLPKYTTAGGTLYVFALPQH